jgi:5-methyltetrahydrofolate--homocysteine methyltransferase
MQIYDQMIDNIFKGEAEEVARLTNLALKQNLSAQDILKNALVAGMDIVSEKFKANEIFIPEVLVSAKAMKAGMSIIRPILAESNVEPLGKVVMGSIQGDLHDIGKNIVAMLLEGAGFEVIDLGADVPIDRFIQTAQAESADIVGMSALLTTTMINMRAVIEGLEKAGLMDVKVMIGGAPVTQAFANQINAHGYADDASRAVDLARGLLGR